MLYLDVCLKIAIKGPSKGNFGAKHIWTFFVSHNKDPGHFLSFRNSANDSELLMNLKIEDGNTPSPNLVREPTTGNSRPTEPKWIVSYPKRWQNPPPLADLSKPSHPLHGAWQRWAPSHGLAVKNSLETNVEGAAAAAHTKQLENHKPNGQDEGKSTAVHKRHD